MRRIIAHQDYNSVTYDNDIALMELDADVTLNQYIWPICLPSATYDFPAGCMAWITGWGAEREGGEFLAHPSVRQDLSLRMLHIASINTPCRLARQAESQPPCRRRRFGSSTARCARVC